MIHCIVQNYFYRCGDGCCFESKYSISLFIEKDNKESRFFYERTYNEMNSIEEVISHLTGVNDDLVELITSAIYIDDLKFTISTDE
jgi:hypothetical protein